MTAPDVVYVFDVCLCLVVGSLQEHGADMRATNRDGKIAIELAKPALARLLADLALRVEADAD